VSGGHTAIRRFFAVILITAAVGCGYLALRDDDAPAATTDMPRLATPLWSPRRVPQPLVDAVGAQRLQGRIDSEMGNQSCVVVSDGAGPVASHNPTLAVAPAPTEKLLTGFAALSTLGPDFKYETKVVAPAAPDNGTVDRLWLVGSGDPVLSTPEYPAMVEADPRRDREEQVIGPSKATTPLAALADSIVVAGVRRVSGGVQGDDSRYDTSRYVPTWDDSNRTTPEIGPIGALTVNHGMRATQPRLTPADDPAVFAASELTDLLKARGVSVGMPGRSTAPANGKPIASVQSATLHDIVAAALESSDNLAAEMFTRELGLRVANQGTTAAGTKVIMDKVRELGVPVEGLALLDGSGLDHTNRVTCTTLLAVLGRGARPEFRALWDGLAVAGQSGTLADQFLGSPLEGKLRGKTGSLTGVSGLAAVIDTGRTVWFAFLANGNFDGDAGAKGVRRRAAEMIGTFPDAPPADQLVPTPSAPTPSREPRPS
jgi:serine-type D-Ala-D-Ala carboxypeptidase/endopeptidase (penicillin-binding protein 4)